MIQSSSPAFGQSREIDMRNLMKYSLRKYPVTSNGELVKTPKCKLMHELLHRANCNDDPPSNADALLLDNMAILQTLKDIPQTFGDLAEKVVRNRISSEKKARGNRVHFICDTYPPPISIKSISEKTDRCRVFLGLGLVVQRSLRSFCL